MTTEPVVHKIIVAHEFPMALPLALRIEEGLLQSSGRNKVKPKKHHCVVAEDTAAASDALENGDEHGNDDEKVHDEAADHRPQPKKTRSTGLPKQTMHSRSKKMIGRRSQPGPFSAGPVG